MTYPLTQKSPDQLRGLVDEQPIGYVTANGMRMLIQDEATVMLYRHDYLIRPDHVALYIRPAPAAPQAEPKREPLSDEQMRAVLIAEARRIAVQAGEKDPDSLTLDEEMLAQVMLAGRAVERAYGIGGSDE